PPPYYLHRATRRIASSRWQRCAHDRGDTISLIHSTISGVVSSEGIRIPAARRSPTPEPLSPRGRTRLPYSRPSPRHDAMREPDSLFCLRLLPPDDQTRAGSSSGTITFCAVPVISMQRHVEGRCGTEFGPLKVS